MGEQAAAPWIGLTMVVLAVEAAGRADGQIAEQEVKPNPPGEVILGGV